LSNSEAGAAVSATADAICQTLGEDESLIGVSPEGEAWVDGEDGVRHVSPDGTTTLVDADFTRADALLAWDAAAAFVVGDNSLWSTTFAGAQPLSLPPELGKPRFVCGDPERTTGAFVITTRGLFEKTNDTWLRWSFPIELLDSMQIRDLQGACSGQDPVMYVEAGESLWEVRYGERASFRELGGLAGANAIGPDVRVGFIALREGELLRFDGEGWAGIPFDEGAVTAADAADGVLWAAVDGTLYRRNQFDEWERLEAPMWPTPITEIQGYAAGGAWLVRTNQLCHVQPRETIRVNGVRPYGRLPEGSGLQVGVSGDPAMGSSLSARLDGQGLQVSGGSGAWQLRGPETLSPGWHTLSLHVASAEGAVERSVKFLVEGGETPAPPMPEPPGEPTVTWEEDIRPIYERSCSPCHGEGGNNTFMGSFEAFSALGELGLSRVSSGEMPPPAASAVAEPLSNEEVELLRTWVQEGMNP
jgi:mono/diheme cytochrome c family protein